MTEPIALLAQRVADRFAELAAHPVALDASRSNLSDASITNRARTRIALLEALPKGMEIVVQQGPGLHLTAMSGSNGHCEISIDDRQLELSHPGTLVTLDLRRLPALSAAVEALAPPLKAGFLHHQRDVENHAPAHAAARTVIAAACGCLATMLARLSDPQVRAQADEAVARASRAANVCKAMIEAHMPRRLDAVSVDLARRRIHADILLDGCRDVTQTIDLPIPDALRDMLPGHEIATAGANVATIPGSPSRMSHKGGFVLDLSLGLPIDYDELEADPAARAALLRQYGSDGSDLAAAIASAFSDGLPQATHA